MDPATVTQAFETLMAASVKPTAEELDDLSLACTKLFTLDYARLTPGVDYAINLQVLRSRSRSRSLGSLGRASGQPLTNCSP